ncbi:MAG: bifunctional diaminohydroxyphosphoribosylaminopyrimidine deaminase/5-amino-6-(5-phosphoribosylamino)uracil reductase RibD, partial [Blastocatellia bacterium]
MARAIELASQGEGLVSPNPMVGAVVVRAGQVIGEGFHRFELLRHAESYALEAAGTKARGATLYCNLEPCSHQGRTPPCTMSVIASGISGVVIGMIDPDPRVNGRGVEQLKQAGVDVTVGVLQAESELLNEIYVKNGVRRAP